MIIGYPGHLCRFSADPRCSTGELCVFIFVSQDGRLIGKNAMLMCSIQYISIYNIYIYINIPQYLLHSNCHKIWNIPWFFRTKLFLTPRLLRKNPIESHNMPTNWLVSPQWVGPKLAYHPIAGFFLPSRPAWRGNACRPAMRVSPRLLRSSEAFAPCARWDGKTSSTLACESFGMRRPGDISGQWQGWLP